MVALWLGVALLAHLGDLRLRWTRAPALVLDET
jgi:hypothetical protein